MEGDPDWGLMGNGAEPIIGGMNDSSEIWLTACKLLRSVIGVGTLIGRGRGISLTEERLGLGDAVTGV